MSPFPLKPKESEQPPPKPPSLLKKVFGPLAVIGILLAKFGGALLPLLKVLQLAKLATFGAKFLTTGGSMLLSIWFYAQRWGWKFAAGFVLSIFVHELGHVFVAWRKGVPVTAPLFIPGFGALILQKRAAKSKWDEAMIGIGGPVAGTLAGFFCFALGMATNNSLFLALAYTTFLLNLFNLLPIMPLDGGWIVGAISPKLFVLGVAGFLYLFISGYIHNPMILLIVILAVPGMIHAFRKRHEPPPPTGASTGSRALLGISYLALCGLLVGMMAISRV